MELMEWSAVLGNVGEFVGAIAVVLTLIYLATQVRQSKVALEMNTKATTASAVLAAHQQDAHLQTLLAGEDNADLYVRGIADYPHLSPPDNVRFQVIMNALFNGYEIRFFQGRDVIPSGFAVGEQWDNLRYHLRQDGVRTYWRHMGGLFSTDFKGFVDSLVEA